MYICACIMWIKIRSDFFIAFVQDDNDVQYLLDNMPISMHKVSNGITEIVLCAYIYSAIMYYNSLSILQ